MRRLIIAAAALILSLWAVVPLPAAAQSTIDELMVICTDVINRQVAAVDLFSDQDVLSLDFLVEHFSPTAAIDLVPAPASAN